MELKNVLGSLSLVVLLGFTTGCSDVYGCGGELSKIVDSKVLVVGTEAGYKPFEYVDSKTGDIKGFDIKFASLIEEKIETTYNTDIKVVFKDMKFDGLIGSLQANQIDIIAAAFSITDKRKESVLFSDSYFQAQTVVIAKDGDSSITDMETLKSKKLGAQLGTVQDGIINGDGFNGQNKALASVSDLILALLSNSLDALVVEKPVAQSIIAAQNGLKIIDSIEFDDDGGYGIASNYQKGEELIELINSCIEENKSNGKLDSLFIEAANEASGN